MVLYTNFFVAFSALMTGVSSRTTRGVLDGVPDGWTDHGPAPLDHPISLTLAIKQQKIGQLISRFEQVLIFNDFNFNR